jgi:acyl-coenzyme A synthetase/AMP-(fatty) acid ligase
VFLYIPIIRIFLQFGTTGKPGIVAYQDMLSHLKFSRNGQKKTDFGKASDMGWQQLHSFGRSLLNRNTTIIFEGKPKRLMRVRFENFEHKGYHVLLQPPSEPSKKEDPDGESSNNMI